jgi:predicted transcriptional regulator
MDMHELRSTRRLHEFSGDAVARVAGIGKFRLCRLELGYVQPHPGELEKIADAINQLALARCVAADCLMQAGLPLEVLS